MNKNDVNARLHKKEDVDLATEVMDFGLKELVVKNVMKE
mgnify:CR=1 FL=1